MTHILIWRKSLTNSCLIQEIKWRITMIRWKKYHRESYQIRSNFQQLQKEFDENLNNQNKFYKNSMFLFETLLWFICAWQQQLWELHLQSLHCLCPYLFIFNILNYANLTPIYLLQMYQLCNDDLIIWNRCWRGVYCK